MGTFDRGLVAIYSLAVSAALVFSVLVYLGWDPVIRLADDILQQKQALLTGTGLLFLVGIRLLWASVFNRKQQKPVKHAIVEENALGQVKVSLQAVESLVHKVVSQKPGIKEVKPKVLYDAENIGLEIKMLVAPDLSIPEMSKEIQQEVQDKILDVIGIRIDTIKIAVENIVTTKPRVE
ncbi:MAG: alkaline shock response membrane anchor protein AmaP [Peptococcaceae bacterium]|nr:alkaline shock response membrane anchor protein AmaP [Peptococcaceae bacterium]